ncbi:IclR family transcriptional regulator C-terminal domain-containing protein [Parafrankia sp. EUN1f]|uniref:IclR family transcriptional regulator domain-containing protein n=1 Tax=Parafrankia sp. EUN1f TaxID=102897 RepID=UPI000568A276|nr:IclR family transcriptional regulator C-terminal domain-containing protein [Parafrankia sp. EUN1f]
MTRPGEGTTVGMVGPLDRGLAVLRALARLSDDLGVRGQPGVPAVALVRATGLPRSTVDRVLLTLASSALVDLRGHDVAPAPALAALGNAYLAASRLPDVLTEHVRQLADRFDEAVSVAVPDGGDVRYVVQIAPRRAVSPAFRVGDLLPAERCAPGHLFAAEWDEDVWEAWRARCAVPASGERWSSAPGRSSALEQVSTRPEAGPDLRILSALAAEQGYAVDDQLAEPGLIALAVPVRDITGAHGRAGAVLCAVSVVSHTSRHSVSSLAELALPLLRPAVTSMEAALAADADVGPVAGATSGHAAAGVDPSSARPAVLGTASTPAWLIGETKAALGRGYLQSLARGLTLITAFDARLRHPTLSDLARATGLPRATVRRGLFTLVPLGYVRQDGVSAGATFRPLPRILDLGFTSLTRKDLGAVAQPHLVRLRETVGESASLAVLTDGEIRYVARAATTRIMSVDLAVGAMLPAYPTSMGRVLLAGLPVGEREEYLGRVRPRALTRHTVTDIGRLRDIVLAVARDGYALVREELEDGLQSLAVGVRDADGRVAAAVNVSMHADRLTAPEALDRMLEPVRTAAEAISKDLTVLTAYRPMS